MIVLPGYWVRQDLRRRFEGSVAGCARLRSVATVVTVWVIFDAILVWSTPELLGGSAR